LDLAFFALWCFLVAFAGGLVGLVLGNIRLPATLLVASSTAAGGGANLAISAIAALTAATVHIRHGRINWRLVAWMAPPSVVGAVAGGDGGELDVRAAVLSGAVIGLLGGLVGLILGSLRMPALLRWVGEVPQRAVGTNVTVGVFVGVAGSLAHLPNAAPDLGVIAAGGAASIPGALLGSRLTGRLSEAALIRAIAVVLLIAAAGCIVQALT
jgi:uncharacterized membrane protein YfcA